jgi:hypothetical protein
MRKKRLCRMLLRSSPLRKETKDKVTKASYYTAIRRKNYKHPDVQRGQIGKFLRPSFNIRRSQGVLWWMRPKIIFLEKMVSG